MEKTIQQGDSQFLLLTNYYLGRRMKENEVRACSTHRRQGWCVQGFGGEDVRERDHLEDLYDGRKTILKWVSQK